MTGIAILVDELEVKRLQLLEEALPTVSRIAVMWNADNPVWVGVVQRLREVVPTSAGHVPFVHVHRPRRIDVVLR